MYQSPLSIQGENCIFYPLCVLRRNIFLASLSRNQRTDDLPKKHSQRLQLLNNENFPKSFFSAKRINYTHKNSFCFPLVSTNDLCKNIPIFRVWKVWQKSSSADDNKLITLWSVYKKKKRYYCKRKVGRVELLNTNSLTMARTSVIYYYYYYRKRIYGSAYKLLTFFKTNLSNIIL